MNNNLSGVNNLPHQKKPGSWKNIWVFIIILAVLVVIIGAIYFATTRDMYFEQEQITDKTNVDDGWPDEIYSYLGTVKEVNGNKIVLLAEAEKNYLRQDTMLTAVVNAQTEYIKLIIPRELRNVEAGPVSDLFEKQEISLGGIQTGDTLIVIAEKNIKNKTEFIASRVEVNEIKK